MKFRIHFTACGVDDYFDIEADTIEDIRMGAQIATEERGLDPKLHNVWSEEIK